MPRRQTLPNLTDEYRRDNHPDPLSGRDAERAARKHFRDTPMSGAAWRGWVYVTLPGNRNKQIAVVQISRDLRVDYLGAVPIKLTRDLALNDRVYLRGVRDALTVADIHPYRRKLVVELKPAKGGMYDIQADPDLLWVMAA